jgi:hypothetical protein
MTTKLATTTHFLDENCRGNRETMVDTFSKVIDVVEDKGWIGEIDKRIPEKPNGGALSRSKPVREQNGSATNLESQRASSRSSSGSVVRFEFDQDQNIQEHFAESNTFLTDEDLETLWWSRDERAEITMKARMVVAYYRKNRKDFILGFVGLLNQCAQSSNLEEYRFDVKDIKASRGLERHMIKALRGYRHRFEENLLNIQSQIPSDWAPEKRAIILATKCAYLTKPAKNLARFHAQQDAIWVAHQPRDSNVFAQAALSKKPNIKHPSPPRLKTTSCSKRETKAPPAA